MHAYTPPNWSLGQLVPKELRMCRSGPDRALNQGSLSYLNPDVLIDSTSCRWKMKKRSIVGMATTTDAAMM